MNFFLRSLKYLAITVLVLVLALIAYICSLTFTPYGRMDWRQAAFAKLASFNAISAEQYTEMTSEDFRKMMPEVSLESIGSVDSLKITTDSLPLFIYKPVGLPQNSPVVIYYHGGGFFMPFTHFFESYARQYANCFKTIVVAIDYRTAPQFPFPTPVNDCYNTFKWVVEHAKSFGGNSDKIAVIGESAGANLAAVVSQKAKNNGFTNIKYQVLFCPSTDGAHTYPSAKEFESGYFLDKNLIDFASKSYLPAKEIALNPEVSPLLANSLSGLPPAFVITAEFDPLHDEGVAYFKKLGKDGVPVRYKELKGCIHVAAGPFMDNVKKELHNEMAIELKKAFN